MSECVCVCCVLCVCVYETERERESLLARACARVMTSVMSYTNRKTSYQKITGERVSFCLPGKSKNPSRLCDCHTCSHVCELTVTHADCHTCSHVCELTATHDCHTCSHVCEQACVHVCMYVCFYSCIYVYVRYK